MLEENTSKNKTSYQYVVNRAVGQISDQTKIHLCRTGPNKGHIAVPIGDSYQIFQLDNLDSILFSRIFNDRISSIYTLSKNTYVGFESGSVIAQHRTQTLGTYKDADINIPIKGILIVGSFLICWTIKAVYIWILNTFTLHGKIFSNDENNYIQDVLHPDTMVNKIIVAFSDSLELWNFNSLKKIYTFGACSTYIETKEEEGQEEEEDDVNKNCIYTCLSLTNSTEIIAVGNSKGEVKLLDIIKDKVYREVKMDDASVTQIASFSDAVNLKTGIIVIGTSAGEIVIWDTINSEIKSIIEKAHFSAEGIVSLLPVPGEPLLISTGNDNCIIVWILENYTLRELRLRRGFRAPPCHLLPYSEINLLAACNKNGSCDLGFFSMHKTSKLLRFSQRKMINRITKAWKKPLKHLNEIISIAALPNRHYDWGNVITAHQGLSIVFVWTAHNQTLLEMTIDYHKPEKSAKKPHATAVAISTCGSFCAIGYKNGDIQTFNLQSGSFRKSLTSVDDRNDNHTFKKNFSNNVNNNNSQITHIRYELPDKLYTASKDSTAVKCWSQYTGNLDHIIDFSSVHPSALYILKFTCLGPYICSIVRCKNNMDLVALADSDTGAVVRVLPNITNDTINNLQFSVDGRWIIYSTENSGQLVIYDIISKRTVDYMQFESPIRSFIATFAYIYVSLQHLDGGLLVLAAAYLHTQTDYRIISEIKSPIKLYSSACYDDDNQKSSIDTEMETLDNQLSCITLDSVKESKDLSHLIRTSNSPHQKLVTLINLDEIYSSTEFTDHLKIKETAEVPFFLPSKNDLLFEAEKVQLPVIKKSDSKKYGSVLSPYETLKELLKDTSNTNGIFDFFTLSTPAAIHLAISELDSESDYIAFLEFIHNSLCNKNKVDNIHAYFRVFLDLHIETLETGLESNKKPNKLSELLKAIFETVEQDWKPMEFQLYQLESLLKFLTNAQLS